MPDSSRTGGLSEPGLVVQPSQEVRQISARLPDATGSTPQAGAVTAAPSLTREEMLELGLTASQVDARLVRQHENEVLQAHFMRWVFCSFVVFTLIVAVGLGVQAWLLYEYVESLKKCDAPLHIWVEVLLGLWIVRLLGTCIDRCICCWHPDPETPEPQPLRILFKNVGLAVFDFVWVVVMGLTWLGLDGNGSEPACRDVNPGMVKAAKTYIYFHMASVVYVWMNIIGLRQMLRVMMRRGLLKTSSAAPPDAIENNTTFVSLDDSDIEVIPSCPVCMEDFLKNGQGTQAVVKTKACGHIFHKQCLKNWLKTAKTCPICRHDLAEFVPSQDGKA